MSQAHDEKSSVFSSNLQTKGGLKQREKQEELEQGQDTGHGGGEEG